MAAHTHTLRKKLRNAINDVNGIDETIKMLIAIATNNAEDYGHEKVTVKDMMAASKLLLEHGIDVERDIAELLKEDEAKAIANPNDKRYEKKRKELNKSNKEQGTVAFIQTKM